MNPSRNDRLSTIIGSISIVMLVGSQYLNEVFFLYFGSKGGFFTPIIISVFALFFISILLKQRIKRNHYVELILLAILAGYILTLIIQPGRTSLNTTEVLGMCVLPIIVGAFLSIDFTIVFRGCMLLLLLAVPVFQPLFLKANIGLAYDAVSMSTSYDILPIVSVGLIHMVFFWKESKLLDKLLYGVSIFFTIALFRMSYRGAILALFVALFMAFYFREKRGSLRQKIIIISLGVLAIIVLLNVQSILELLSTSLKQMGIRIAFIDKTIYLLQTDSISHGRMEVYQSALKGFVDSPIIGHGMGTFEYYTGYPFPHNFILEFLFDGGLCLSIPMFAVFYQAIKRLFQTAWENDRHRFAFLLMIGCISITRGLLSAESWRIVLLWSFVGLSLNETGTRSEDKLIGENVQQAWEKRLRG